MKSPESTITYEKLPDTITVLDYMKWRGCGRNVADAVFHSKGFPLIPNQPKLSADKRAVLLFELGLNEEDRNEVLKEMARSIVGTTIERVKTVEVKEPSKELVEEMVKQALRNLI